MRSIVTPWFASMLLVGIAVTAALATRNVVKLVEHSLNVQQLTEARVQLQDGLRLINAGPFARP